MAKVSLMGLWSDFQTWIGRKDNPHKVTAAQVGTYSRQEVDDKIGSYLPAGVLPFSSFDNSSAITASSGPTNANITILNNSANVMMDGRMYKFNSNFYSFTIVTDKPTYLYVNRNPAQGYKSAFLEATTDGTKADTGTRFWVGTITPADGEVNIKMDKVQLFAGFRLSSERRGGAIPVSTGSPMSTGDFKWGN
jgi:hypothetical protein